MEDYAQIPASAEALLHLYPSLGIPHFQRGLVWNDDTTALLLESLYLGTPCGNVILWQPLDVRVHGEPLVGQGECERLIVDGQQRIRMLYESRNGVLRTDNRIWCLDLTAEPGFANLLTSERRQSLFMAAQDPLTTKNPRYKHNLIPVTALVTCTAAALRTSYKVTGRLGTKDDEIEAALAAAGEKVRTMWHRPLFSVITLQEKEEKPGQGGAYGIGYIVSLYNRINSAGRRVEAQEIAYATLVRLYPGTTECLREFFLKVHGKPDADRDTLLHREKERNFGFKLYLRTFVQVCNYHFARSQGTQGFSFDVIDSPWLNTWITQNRDKARTLFDRTMNALQVIREVLRGPLCCDDLRMLPDIDCLIPALQLLIRYPDLATKGHERLIAYLIFRTVLDPERTQESTFKIVQTIERTHDAETCIQTLGAQWGKWSDHKKERLRAALKGANTLSDRYVLLLYWLVRRNQAKDFSYKNLSEEKPLYRCAGAEKPICAEVDPEKQHIAPAARLSTGIFGGDARITTSRHPINNVGNLTFISHELNHFETGLGNHWIDPCREADKAGLARHFIGGEALTLYEELRQRKDRFSGSQEDKDCFERFCAARRSLIQEGFEAWLGELEASFIIAGQRIEPERRLATPDIADEIRGLSYPDPIEDAVLRIAAGRYVKRLADSQKKSKAGDLVFSLRDVAPNRKMHLHFFSVPPRVEIEEREDHAFFVAFRDIMIQEGITRGTDGPRPWVLLCGIEEEDRTGRILERFANHLDG